MSKEELLEKIKNEPGTAKHYLLLAFMLQAPDETVELLKQNPDDPEELPIVMTQQELFLKTIELDDTQALAYLALKNQLEDDETITLNDGRILTKRQLIMEAIDNAPNEPMPYSALAFVTMDDDTVELLDGRVMNQNQLYLEAVHLERYIGLMWFQERYFITAEDTVTLPDGRQLNQEQLVTAIITNRQDSLAIAGLVLTMEPAAEIFIPDQLPGQSTEDPPPGEDKKREDLAVEAVRAAHEAAGEVADDTNIEDDIKEELLARYAFPFMVLLLTMNPGDTVDTAIAGIGETGQMGLLKEIIRLSPEDAQYYLFGGLWLKPGEPFTLPGGQQKNQIEMLQKTIESDPDNAFAHIGLGYSIGAGETISVAGTSMSRQQLFLKAAELDPDLPLVYLCLSLSITPGDQTPITVNGEELTEAELNEKYNSFSEEEGE